MDRPSHFRSRAQEILLRRTIVISSHFLSILSVVVPRHVRLSLPRSVGAQSPSYVLCMVANLVLDHSGGKDTYIGMISGGQGSELALM
jgi:hypothetical protein